MNPIIISLLAMYGIAILIIASIVYYIISNNFVKWNVNKRRRLRKYAFLIILTVFIIWILIYFL